MRIDLGFFKTLRDVSTADVNMSEIRARNAQRLSLLKAHRVLTEPNQHLPIKGRIVTNTLAIPRDDTAQA